MNLRQTSYRIGRLAGYQGSRLSESNQAEDVVDGSNSCRNGLLVNQNRDIPSPELPERPPRNEAMRKRNKWTHQEYKEVLAAYFTAINNPDSNTTNQTYNIWRDLTGPHHHENMDANKLGAVRRYAMKKLTAAEIDEIKDSINKNKNSQSSVNPGNPTQPNTITTEQEAPCVSPNLKNNPDAENMEKILKAKNNIIEEHSITKYTHMCNREQLPKIQINKRTQECVAIYNSALALILQETDKDITTLNNLIYATALAATNSMGVSISKINRTNPRSIPKWKARMNKEVESLRGELSILTELEKGRKVLTHKGRKVLRKYDINDKNAILIAKEVLKQKIMVKSQRLRRYDKRANFYRQNKIFKSDAKKLYRELGNKKIDVTNPPDLKDMENFWKGIWQDKSKFNANATWLEREEERMNQVDQQQWEDISPEELEATLKKTHKWKSPGGDRIPNFWLYYLTSTHQSLAGS